MDINLPAFDQYYPSSITNFYGANFIVEEYVGSNRGSNIINRHWSHGWTIPERQVHPEIISSEPIDSKETMVLVGRKEEERYLKSLGYRSEAIGLPFCYVPKVKCTRMSNSLLVLPSHSTRDLKIIKTSKYNNFIKHVKSQERFFNTIIICMHRDDIELGFDKIWKDSGFIVEQGAAINDKKALLRMKLLFSQYSVMLTDAMGSHVPYAASCGIRIAMRRPEGWDYDLNENQYFIDDSTRLGSDYIQKQDRSAWYSHYKFLFCDPVDAKTHIEWGKKQIGFDNKLSPSELKNTLGWSSPRREYELLMYNGKRVINKIRRMADSFISTRNS